MYSIFRRSGDWRTFLKNTPVTSGIIILNTFYLIAVLVTGGFSGQNLVNLGAIWPPYVTELGEYWRIITGGFMHGSILHFLGNMIIGVLKESGNERRTPETGRTKETCFR